jgi:insulysin
LPDQRGNWKSKPLSYISHLVGHEGKNSLLSELIKQDLATGLSAGPMERLGGERSGFVINVSLTNKGVKEYQNVVRLVFAYLNKIKA